MSVETDCVFTADIAPFLREWMEKYRQDHPRWRSDPFRKGVTSYTPSKYLYDQIGINDRKISSILKEEYKTISLTIADAILTAIDMPYLLSNGTIPVRQRPKNNQWTKTNAS